MSKEFTASNGQTVQLIEGSLGVFVIEGTQWCSPRISTAELTALREFFEWEASRKPWDDAEDGEIWALTVGGVEDAYDRLGGNWFKSNTARKPAVEKITAGRRIWPENAS